MRQFSYDYDPQKMDLVAREGGGRYNGPPAPLPPRDQVGYMQSWSGYCPPCTLEDQEKCLHLPCQTYNIKVGELYCEVEVGTNQWMEMACEEARLAVEQGGFPFGAVLIQVDDDYAEVIRYWHSRNLVYDWNDPTAHAEVMAIRSACKELGVFDLGLIPRDRARMPQRGATSHCELYCSCEPCPMCQGAIYWARVPVVVFAATRFDTAVQGVDLSNDFVFVELGKPYRQRSIRMYQATSPTSLDAFNLWKRTESEAARLWRRQQSGEPCPPVKSDN
jgi:guanine deaminase